MRAAVVAASRWPQPPWQAAVWTAVLLAQEPWTEPLEVASVRAAPVAADRWPQPPWQAAVWTACLLARVAQELRWTVSHFFLGLRHERDLEPVGGVVSLRSCAVVFWFG